MRFTGTVYRNPYWPTFPLLQITQAETAGYEFCPADAKMLRENALWKLK